MEYHSDYVRNWYPDASPKRHGSRRDHYLADRFDPDKRLRDVVAVKLSLSVQQHDHFRRTLNAAGYAAHMDGPETVLIGPGIEFRLLPAEPKQTAITHILMDVSASKRRSMSIGSTQLDLDGTRAVWMLTPALEVTR